MASSLLSFASKTARKSAAWAWKNSGAEDVPVLASGREWFGKNLERQRDKPKKAKSESAVDAKEMIDQPAAGDQPKLVPVGAMTGGFQRQAANDPGEAMRKNREANDRALQASRFQRQAANDSGESGVPSQMVEDIHEIRELLEQQNQNSGGLLSGAMSGILGALSGGMNVGKFAGMFKGLGSKIPGILKGVGGMGAAVSAGAIVPKLLSIPKGIQGTFGTVKDMGAGVLDAAKTKAGAVSAAGKGVLEKGSGLIKGLAGKAGAKTLLKKIPGIGLLAGLGFGVSRAIDGDFTGAGMEVASGLASTVPGIGTAASLGLDAALIARDTMSEPNTFDDGAKKTAAPELKRAFATTETEAVPRGLANLQDFVGAAMDEDRGIFVRVVKDVLRSPSQAERGAGVSAREAKRQQLTPEAKTEPVPAFKREGDTSLAGSPLGNLISRGEGDYNSYNSGTKGVAGGKIGHSGTKDLSSMTLNEIIASSETKNGNDKDRVFAAGRYQVITPTLKASMKKMGLTGDEKFTPELQDRIFQETLLPKSVKDYIGGKSDDVKGAQVDLAKVWRSFADPRTGKTYADAGAVANKASITAAESEKALMQTRSQFVLNNPEQRSLGEIDVAAAEVRSKQTPSASTVVIPVSTKSNVPATSGGDVGFGGHMGTRNNDSSIRRLTDAKMSYGLS